MRIQTISVSIYGASKVFSKCVRMYLDHQCCSSFSNSIPLLSSVYLMLSLCFKRKPKSRRFLVAYCEEGTILWGGGSIWTNKIPELNKENIWFYSWNFPVFIHKHMLNQNPAISDVGQASRHEEAKVLVHIYLEMGFSL